MDCVEKLFRVHEKGYSTKPLFNYRCIFYSLNNRTLFTNNKTTIITKLLLILIELNKHILFTINYKLKILLNECF